MSRSWPQTSPDGPPRCWFANPTGTSPAGNEVTSGSIACGFVQKKRSASDVSSVAYAKDWSFASTLTGGGRSPPHPSAHVSVKSEGVGDGPTPTGMGVAVRSDASAGAGGGGG